MAIFTHCRIIRDTWRHMVKPICTLKTKILYCFNGNYVYFSFSVLKLAMTTIPMGTAYAIWTGIGTAGGAIIGMLFYKESTHFSRIIFIFLILFSVIGLKMI